MQMIAWSSLPPEMPMPTRYRPKSVRRLRRKSGGTLQTCSDLPPTISRNFQFSVFGRIFHIFDDSRDLAQNGGMWGECSRFPPACPFIYWYYLSKARPGSQFRPHNKFIGQKLTAVRAAQYKAILALFLAILPVPHENVRFLVYIYVRWSVLDHNFWCRRDKYANRVSFKSWDVNRQHLGYGVPLLK